MRTKPNDPRGVEKSVRRGRKRESAAADAPDAQLFPASAPRNAQTSDADDDRHQPERTCVLSRRKAGREDLIRLALGPDGNVAPDVRARAPGRGAWIGVTRTELDTANAKGRLKGALQRAFKVECRIPADLGERAESALRQVVLDRLGIESRAGNLITGAERVENAARAGKVRFLIHAGDAREDGRKRMDQAWRVGGGGPQGVIFPEGRTILSLALGRENVVHIALTDVAAASRVQHALARWRSFTGPTSGPEGGEPALRTGSTDEDGTKE